MNRKTKPSKPASPLASAAVALTEVASFAARSTPESNELAPMLVTVRNGAASVVSFDAGYISSVDADENDFVALLESLVKRALPDAAGFGCMASTACWWSGDEVAARRVAKNGISGNERYVMYVTDGRRETFFAASLTQWRKKHRLAAWEGFDGPRSGGRIYDALRKMVREGKGVK